MAETYVNFYAALDPGGYTRGAQAFQGRASQAHRATAAVGASAVAATEVVLNDGTEYAEVRPTSGAVFVCILPAGSDSDARTAARIRIEAGESVTLSRALGDPATLYLWAA